MRRFLDAPCGHRSQPISRSRPPITIIEAFPVMPKLQVRPGCLAVVVGGRTIAGSVESS